MVGIVTGGSKGIGLAIARAFLDRGMQVAISARKRRRSAGARASELGVRHERARASRADVRDAGRRAAARRRDRPPLRRPRRSGQQRRRRQVRQRRRHVARRLAAGHRHQPQRRLLLQPRGDSGDEARAAAAASSTSAAWRARTPFTGGAAYCASKAGLNAFSEALMQEVRHDNIRVSYVMPGSVATEFGESRDRPARQTGSSRPRTWRGWSST